MSRSKHLELVEDKEDDVDLNPLIDVITMLIIFFILGGRMSSDIRAEQITVPPTKTATALKGDADWERIVVNVFGDTQRAKGKTHLGIRVGQKEYTSQGIDDYTPYQGLRQLLDGTYDRATKFADPKGTGLQLPKTIIEIRADADTQYRVVQEIQQVVSDSVNPFDKMLPKTTPVASRKPFVNINFTTRLPGK